MTCSDARVGYRLSDYRPGLIPVLWRASARSWPPSVARAFPTVGPSATLHDSGSPTRVLLLLRAYLHHRAVTRSHGHTVTRSPPARAAAQPGARSPKGSRQSHVRSPRQRPLLPGYIVIRGMEQGVRRVLLPRIGKKRDEVPLGPCRPLAHRSAYQAPNERLHQVASRSKVERRLACSAGSSQ